MRVCLNVGRPNLCVCISLLKGPVRVVDSIGEREWEGRRGGVNKSMIDDPAKRVLHG